MVRCPACDQELRDGAKFCDNCGARVSAASSRRPTIPNQLAEKIRLDEAATHLDVVAQRVAEPAPGQDKMIWRYHQHLLHTRGEWHLRRTELDEARALADACLARAQETGSRRYVVKARRLRAQVLLAQGEAVEALPELETALEIAAVVGNPPQRWLTLLALADAQAASGRPEDARESARRAHELMREVAEKLPVDLRDAFEGSDLVRGCAARLN